MRKAFTLVELLAVIAIIGVLSAIVMVAVNNARVSARSIECVSNLRQLGIAIQLYANNNRGKLPGPLYGSQGPQYNTFNGGSPGSLAKLIEPYLPEVRGVSATAEANRIFDCPGWKSVATENNAAITYMLNARPWAISAGEWDLFPFGDQNSPATSIRSQPRTLNAINHMPLARTWVLIDVDKALMYATNNTSGWRENLIATPAHGTTRNALFFDWHVEKVPASNNTPQL